MQRLVYSPKAYAYVKTVNNGIVALSSDIVSGEVSRRVNQVSTASLTIRNDKRKWTTQGSPVFRPMDPITIYLTRLPGYPVQVFTGYLDQTPYYQLYPGTVTLTASCTLKRLLYTYWDPALPYVNEFMAQYGWIANRTTGELFNAAAQVQLANQDQGAQPKLNDGSIGNLLFATMKRIGRWDPNSIFIEKLPADIPQRVANIYKAMNEEANLVDESLQNMFSTLIGDGSYGNGGAGAGADSTGTIKGADKIVPAMKEIAAKHNIPAWFPIAVSIHESALGNNMRNTTNSATGYYQWLADPWGFPNTNAGRDEALRSDKKATPGSWVKCGLAEGKYLFKDSLDLGLACDGFCTAARLALDKNGQFANDPVGWAEYIQGATGQFSDLPGQVDQAKKLLSSYGKPLPVGTNPNPGHDPSYQPTEVRKAKKGKTPTSSSSTSVQIYAPIAGGSTTISSPFGEKNHGNPPHTHMGIDVPVPTGTHCIAPCDGRIGQFASATSGFGGYGGMVHFVFDQDVGDIKKGTVIGWGHIGQCFVQPNTPVKGGTVIATSNHPAPHVHFIQREDDNDMDGTVDPTALFKALQQGQTAVTSGGSVSTQDSSTSASGTDSILATAKASAFAANFNFPSVEEVVESILLTGERSLMNDQPLLPFIQQLCEGSLRHFQSMPNGNFFAFFPDYFGNFNHRKPYWEIDDIEVLDGKIELSDENLVTHMYVVGDTINLNGAIDTLEKIQSRGVVTLFNAGQASWLESDPQAAAKKNGKAKTSKNDKTITEDPLFGTRDDVLAFLQRYGARPLFESAPFVRSSYFEVFLAWQRFMQAWSRQFLTTFSFTFMPELYPGGLVSFPTHGLQMYVEEVYHSWDMESGFTTQANLSSPAALANNHSPIARGLVVGSNNF